MQMISPAKKEFIEFMMSADVLRFGEFTTKSGRLSPYFDNTGNYRTGAQIATLGKFYAQCIMDNCGDNFDAMFGPAYKAFRWSPQRPLRSPATLTLTSPTSSTARRPRTTAKAVPLVGYKPQDGDRVIIIEDVITAGTAVRETVPVLQAAAKVSIRICSSRSTAARSARHAGKTAVMEVKEEFGINVHAIITVADIHEYLKEKPEYASVLSLRSSTWTNTASCKLTQHAI